VVKRLNGILTRLSVEGVGVTEVGLKEIGDFQLAHNLVDGEEFEELGVREKC
jgi:hypothetical protein